VRKKIVNFLKNIGLYKPFVFFWNKIKSVGTIQQEKRNHQKRISFYSSFLSAGDIAFDVGANMGNRVSVFLKLGCKVVAIEPQKECYTYLRRKFGRRIAVVPLGLGEKEEERVMYISNVNTVSSFSNEWIESVKKERFKNINWNQAQTIKMTTLENLIAEFGKPKFCKIDVEGFELEVLKGLKQPLPYLSMEYTVPEQTEKLAACVDYCFRLSSNSQFNYSVGEEMKLELPEYINYEEFNKLIRTEQFIRSGFGDVYIKSI
jgi:FkbM family methyltransferase